MYNDPLKNIVDELHLMRQETNAELNAICIRTPFLLEWQEKLERSLETLCVSQTKDEAQILLLTPRIGSDEEEVAALPQPLSSILEAKDDIVLNIALFLEKQPNKTALIGDIYFYLSDIGLMKPATKPGDIKGLGRRLAYIPQNLFERIKPGVYHLKSVEKKIVPELVVITSIPSVPNEIPWRTYQRKEKHNHA